MTQEQTHWKITLLLVKDWDGFQAAMHEARLWLDGRHKATGGRNR